MTDRPADQLADVFDRFVAAQRTALPTLVDIRDRVRRNRRRRLTVATAAIVLTAVGITGGVWMARVERGPDVLVMADGQVRLNDWVTLTWLPDDVVSVEDQGTNDPAAMETFGYWQGHFRLSRGLERPIVVRIALGDAFDVDIEASMVADSTIEGDRVRRPIEDGRLSIYTQIGDATVQVVGDDAASLHRLLDGMRVTTPTLTIPGRPVRLASGVSDGVPWEVRVTTPTAPMPSVELSGNGACLIVKRYTSWDACIMARDDSVLITPIQLPWESRPLGPIWFLFSDTAATAFEYVSADGTPAKVDALSAAPAPGVFAVVDAGVAGPLTGVRALAADGTVLQDQDLSAALP